MILTRLHVHHLRNLDANYLSFHEAFNFIIGRNGSGKTSLLEAVNFLFLGRSFRSHFAQSVIQAKRNSLTCFGELRTLYQQFSIGVEKSREGALICKKSGKEVRISELAALLPLQVLTPDTFKILLSGSEERRKWLDWGVFHVKPCCARDFQRYQRLLKQRNALLKSNTIKPDHLRSWDIELAEVGSRIAELRSLYFESFKPFLVKLLIEFLPDIDICCQYQAGWSQEYSLQEALERSYPEDRKAGHTKVGPHRAEIAIRCGEYLASQVLSRGQLKLFVCALLIAQTQHLANDTSKRSLYLLDDLASELDEQNRMRILQKLADDKHQVVITSADKESWQLAYQKFSHTMFHVEHGQIEAAALE